MVNLVLDKFPIMKINKPLRWGIIGCGAVTEVKSGPPYQNTNDFQLHAVMRRNFDKAQDYAKRHGVSHVFNNADDLIFSDEIDAVYIATPPDTHKFYGLKVAEAGKPCCIEKPLAPSYEDSKVIYNAFNDKDLPLFVAYYRRSLPRFLKVKEWLENNEIGDVRHINWTLTKPASDWDLNNVPNWRTDAKVAPGGYFDDLASHGLDLFAYLLGDFKEVFGIGVNQQGFYTAKDAVVASWLHTSGVTGASYWNFGVFKAEDKVEIIGSKGRIAFPVFDEEKVVLENSNGKQELWIEHPKHVQQFHVENMADDLFGKSIHPSPGKSALHTSWVMDRILGVL